MTTELTHPASATLTPEQAMRIPHNLEAEQALLGALLMNNEAINHIGQELKPDHFYAGVHQRIFGAFQQFHRDGKVANPVTLKRHFEGEQGIESKYLVRLVTSSTSVVNLQDYARVITEMAMKRHFITTAQDIINLATSAESDENTPAALSALLATSIEEVTHSTSMRHMRNSRETAQAFILGFENPKQRTPTGLPRFDKALGGGFMRGQLYALMAGPGRGKTMMAVTISHHLNHTGHKHLFICAEMGDEEIHARSLARDVQCSTGDFYSDQQLMQEAAYYANRDPGNVIYQSDSFLTFDRLQQYVANAVARHHIEGFVLDYFQLVKGVPRGMSKVEHFENVAQWIAAICKRYDIWALVTGQLNDEGKVRWGDALEMAATNLFFLHRVNEAGEDDKSGELAWIQTEKARHTKFMNVGTPKAPAFKVNEKGPFFEEINDGPLFSMQ